MAEYHVGLGAFDIYAGTLNKAKTMWVNKSPVTLEAVEAVAQYLMRDEACMKFTHNGRRYVLKVEEVDND